MVDKFSSIDMKSTTTKSVLELKGELRLICCTQATWDMWTTFFDAHSAGDIINPETEEKYNAVKDGEAPPILREFFRPLQGLTESELHRCAVHLLGTTLGRKLPYPKIFLKRPRHRPGTYNMKEWCEHRKMKTNAMRELGGLLPEMQLFDAEGDINWAKWREFKLAYNINGASMRSLVKEHTTMLKLKGNKRAKKTETDASEVRRYIMFLERKRTAKFSGVARFCHVTVGVNNTTFSGWDDRASRMEVREDRSGSPFGLIDFRCIPGCTRQGIKGMPFYEPFMTKLLELKSPGIREPHVWLWIVDQERLAAVTDLYDTHIKFQYTIVHSAYLPCKTEGITLFNEARGVKQVGTVSLLFLTYNTQRDGRLPIPSTHFSKLYSVPHPPPKDLFQETLYSVYPGKELRLDFYINILQGLTMSGETVYNIFGGSKFIYASMVRYPLPHLRTCVRKCHTHLHA